MFQLHDVTETRTSKAEWMHKPFYGRDGASAFPVNDLEYAVAWAFAMLQPGFALQINAYTCETGEMVNIVDRDGRPVLSVFHDANNIIATRENAVASTMVACHKSLIAALNAFRRPRGAQRASIAVTLAGLIERREQFGRHYSNLPCRRR